MVLRQSNLPPAPQRLIGRATMLETLQRRLQASRLLTLTGPGGSGKTLLAIHLAAAWHDATKNPAWFIALAPLADPAIFIASVASTIGCQEERGIPPIDRLLTELASLTALIVLDNCEHLIEDTARFVAAILRACPGIRFIATSREALAIDEEILWPIPPLSVPATNDLLPAAAFAHSAVQLFTERATACRPDFVLDHRTTPAVIAICQQLDGLPLAIELATARLRHLSLAELQQFLEEGIAVLSHAKRDGDQRHQTLYATIDWSYGLLPLEEQRALRSLAILASPFTSESASAVLGESTVVGTLYWLSTLIEKSLITPQQDRTLTRYHMLATVRQFGVEQFRAAGEERSLQERLIDWGLRFAEKSHQGLSGPDQVQWIQRTEEAHHQLRMILGWLYEREDVPSALRLATWLKPFWQRRGFLSEGIHWLECGARSGQSKSSPQLVAKAHNAAGMLHWSSGHFAAAEHHHQSALTISREAGLSQEEAEALLGLGYCAERTEQLHEAAAHLAQALSMFQALRDHAGIASAYHEIALIAVKQRAYATAQNAFERCLAERQSMGHIGAVAVTLHDLALLSMEQGDFTGAAARFREVIAIFTALGDEHLLASAWLNVADLALRTADPDQAEAAIRTTLSFQHTADDPYTHVLALEALSIAAWLRGDDRRLVQALGCATWHREQLQFKRFPSEHEEFERHCVRARAALDSTTYEAFWREGEARDILGFIEEFLRPPLAPVAESSSAIPTTTLVLQALGGAHVLINDREIDPATWTYAKARELVFYLIESPQSTKDQIGLALWPEASTEQVRSQFRVVMHHARRALGDVGWIIFSEGRYRFDRTRPMRYDVEQFMAAIATGDRLTVTAPSEAIAAYEDACAHYQGPLLNDTPFGDWVLGRRHALQATFLRALLTIGRVHATQRRYRTALEAYQRAAHAEPLDERAHRGILRCYLYLGETTHGIRHYQSLQRLLKQELDAQPESATNTIYARLRQGVAS